MYRQFPSIPAQLNIVHVISLLVYNTYVTMHIVIYVNILKINICYFVFGECFLLDMCPLYSDIANSALLPQPFCDRLHF